MTRVIVTRSDREFSGKSNWCDVTPEFDRIAASPARMISMQVSEKL